MVSSFFQLPKLQNSHLHVGVSLVVSTYTVSAVFGLVKYKLDVCNTDKESIYNVVQLSALLYWSTISLTCWLGEQ